MLPFTLVCCIRETWISLLWDDKEYFHSIVVYKFLLHLTFVQQSQPFTAQKGISHDLSWDVYASYIMLMLLT